MTILGAAENVVLQYGGIRAIHGWLDFRQLHRYLFVTSKNEDFLFQIIYDYPRPDAEAHRSHARGYLGEIVYGSSAIMARLPRPFNAGFGLVFLKNFELTGTIECQPIVNAALNVDRAQ